MTENKRFKYSSSLEKVYDCDTFNGETTESYGTFECCDMLNQLNDENEQLKVNYKELRYANNIYCNKIDSLKKENEKLKKILNELSDMLQFDVENGIRSYPVKLSEYLSNALKELIV